MTEWKSKTSKRQEAQATARIQFKKTLLKTAEWL